MARQNSRPPGWLGERSVAFWTVIGGVVAVITLIITLIAFAKGGSSANSPPHSASSSQTIGTPGENPSNSSPASSGPDQSPTISPAKPEYLTNLDYQITDSTAVGLAFIGGKRYQYSFSEEVCINDPITVPLSPGYTKFEAVVGYADGSGFRDGAAGGGPLQAELDYTTDPDSLSGNPQWIRLDVVNLPTQKRGVDMIDQLPPNVTGLQLVVPNYACSTTMVWGNPRVS
jgi:hypothetical protein